MGNMICGGESAETQVSCFTKNLVADGKSIPTEAGDKGGWNNLGLESMAGIDENPKVAEFILKILQHPDQVSVMIGDLDEAEQNKAVACLGGMAVIDTVGESKLLRLYTKQEWDKMHAPVKEEEQKEAEPEAEAAKESEVEPQKEEAKEEPKPEEEKPEEKPEPTPEPEPEPEPAAEEAPAPEEKKDDE
eukprot:TRINITY_DN9869_c2_g1_i1.p1 TRINITY_DN9869_c2_g1~~TRINITY_DN9869_c2_g1_i1.p1  ORF type:complete len:196 (+),score=71.98 TRINITY_DN9869_c2_g1_i1:23-589(+)